MARSTTIRLPGTDGPDIVIERGAVSKPRVRIDGKDVPRSPGSKDSYAVVTAEGTTRSFTLKSDRNGLRVIADDGNQFALDPPRPLWETVLAFLPVGLVAIGGLIGGAFGGLAAAGNIAISRSNLQTPVRIAAMLALSAMAGGAWLVIAFTLAVGSIPVPAYAAGQCVNGIDASTAPMSMPRRSRRRRVRNHIVARSSGSTPSPATAAGATFPGMPAIEAAAVRPLPVALRRLRRDRLRDSRLEHDLPLSERATGGAGDREIACIATGTRPAEDLSAAMQAGAMSTATRFRADARLRPNGDQADSATRVRLRPDVGADAERP